MTADAPAPGLIAPGSTIGILGTGQLARMTCLSAIELGYRCHVYGPDTDPPAGACAQVTTAAYEDLDALTAFGRSVDVVTLDFENVPADPVVALAEIVLVRPGATVLAIAQDRVAEKDFANRLGIATTEYATIAGEGDVAAAAAAMGGTGILKSRRLGYDGKGQVRIGPGCTPEAAWTQLGGVPSILEAIVPFTAEISVIAARGTDGAMTCFDPVRNHHENHILDRTIAPAPISDDLAVRAQDIARTMVEGLDLIGLLAVEMFVTADDRLLVNEIAPRPHNSGHWTIDACATSQFEQLVRAICGLPLGDPTRHSDAVMHNLIGDAVNDWQGYLRNSQTRLHLYGKGQARAGRKMGHVTVLTPRSV